jgi:predicted kinase
MTTETLKFSKPTVWIMQGVSGAGKSSSIPANAKVVSADHYFVDKDGNYKFDPSQLGLAHAECLRLYVEALLQSNSFVVVDNTNTTVAEVAPYYALANAYGYDAVIVHIAADVGEASARNTHGVPYAGVKAQYDRIGQFSEQMPPWWQRVTRSFTGRSLHGAVNVEPLEVP